LCGLALLAFAVFKLLPNDERLIRKQMDRMAEAASIKHGEGNLARLSKANKLSEFFTRDARINLEAWGYNIPVITSRSDLREAVLAAHARLGQAEFQVSGFNVSFPDGKQTAIAYVFITGEIDSEQEKFGQQFRMELERVEHRWLINTVSLVEGLR
jgi:hypothetical protein